MAEKDEQIADNYRLTQNVLTNDKVLGLNKRNWAEAIIITAMFLIGLNLIPFTMIVRGFASAVFGTSLFVFLLRGIKHRSVIQMILKEYKFRKNRRRLHLRSPEYVRKKVRSSYSESEDESIAEHYFKYVKGRIDRFIDEYSEEENSK